MNQTTSATPTLLSITPAKPAPKAEAEEGFADELSSAASRAEKPNETSKKPDAGSAAEADTDPDNRDASADEAEAAAEASEPTESSDVSPQPAEDAVDLSDESGLLAVAIVSETLVVETPPTAQLPEEAATQIDVSIEPIGPQPTGKQTGESDATSTLTGGFDAEPVLESTSSTVEPEAAEGEAPTPIAEQAKGQNPFLPVDEEADDASPRVQQTAREAGEAVTRVTPSAQPTTPHTGEQVAQQPTAASTTPTTQPTETIESEAESDSKSATPATQAAKPLEPAAELAPEVQTESTATPRESGTPQPAATSNSAGAERTNGIAKPATGPAEALPAVDPARFVTRVARAFDLAQERGGGPIEIRLSPPELGSLQVKIELKEGVLSAALEAETPAARQTLLDNLPALRDRLEQQQIRIDKFDVDVRDDSQQRGGDWQPSGDARERGDERDDRREPTADTPAPTNPESERPASQTASTIDFGSDEINLVA